MATKSGAPNLADRGLRGDLALYLGRRRSAGGFGAPNPADRRSAGEFGALFPADRGLPGDLAHRFSFRRVAVQFGAPGDLPRGLRGDFARAPRRGVGPTFTAFQRAGYDAPSLRAVENPVMPESAFSYDVCVIGGAGHVGLPFALICADSGLAHRHLRHRQRQGASRSAPARCRSSRRAPTRCCAACCATGRLTRRGPPGRRSAECRFLVMIIGTPVDEHLNPSFAAIDRVLDALPASTCATARS